MTTLEQAADTIRQELTDRGTGFSPEGYEHATARLRELTALKGLALKTLAGRINREAGA